MPLYKWGCPKRSAPYGLIIRMSKGCWRIMLRKVVLIPLSQSDGVPCEVGTFLLPENLGQYDRPDGDAALIVEHFQSRISQVEGVDLGEILEEDARFIRGPDRY